MIDVRNKRIIINGEPRLIISGEIHYYRLQREEWRDRIGKLKAAGCNAVASYIPWLCHEPVEGQVDLEGKSRPQLDLGGFIDMCRDEGLYFIARPGPFVMAEMKNEGIPYWVYTKYPQAVPVTWDDNPTSTRTLDYLSPGLLEAALHWYHAVMSVVAPRLQTNGGNIIGVQLDNEIGMLSWISNSPDLTDLVLADMSQWLATRYDADELSARYPFMLHNPEVRNAAMRSPDESYAVELMHDLGHYMRGRFARYTATLRDYAQQCGIRGVPLMVNVHGTDQGRGLTFPIGISQLYEAYTQDPTLLAGSDLYLGDLDGDNFQDLYLINAFMEAVNLPDQPLTSLEFECGSGDYGGTSGRRRDPSSVSHKTRMCIAQGHRLVNYYLFTGGINYLLDEPVNDGNDRISFTGERHGVAAPVNPEGLLNYSYEPLKRVASAMMAVAPKLADMDEERDSLAFAFVPDYYMTESRYPSSARVREIVQNLEAHRGPDAWESVARAVLYAGYRFSGVDVQNRPLDPATTPVLVLASARYMDAALQQKLAGYLEAGGKVLLYGEVPMYDMEGQACTELSDRLGLAVGAVRQASAFYYLSIAAERWAAPMPELRSDHAQALRPDRGEVFLRIVGTGEPCGVEAPVGASGGRAIVISSAYSAGVEFYRQVLERLGAVASLRHDCLQEGIFLTSTANREGERFVHILNLDGFEKVVHLSDGGKTLFDGRALVLRPHEGAMLPVNVRFGDVRVVYSTAEVAWATEDRIDFRLTQPQDVICLETSWTITACDDYAVETRGNLTVITSCKHASVDDRLSILA